MAFMAYVSYNSGGTPTSVEFQYYCSVSNHTATQQGDQVFVYTLNSSSTWSVTTREAASKIVAGENMTSSYSDGTLTLNADGYTLPTMAANTKGGAKLGSGLSVADDTLSLSGESYTSAEKTKLAGIEANANNYTLPTMGASTKGGAKLGDGLSVANDVLSVDVSDVASGQLPIANGGTGAATAAAALSNLGAAAVDSDGFVTVAGEPSYPLFIWDSTHVSPEDYSGTYPISPCFIYYIPNKGLYYCTDN